MGDIGHGMCSVAVFYDLTVGQYCRYAAIASELSSGG